MEACFSGEKKKKKVFEGLKKKKKDFCVLLILYSSMESKHTQVTQFTCCKPI